MNALLTRLRPLTLAALLLLAFGGFRIVGPAPWLVPEDPAGAGLAIGDLLRSLLPPVLPVLLLGLAVTLAACGPGDVRAAAAVLLGGGDEAHVPAARRTLAVGARSVVGAGLLLAFLAAVSVYLLGRASLMGAQPEDLPSPQRFAELTQATIFAPLVALAVGRVVLAGAADALAARHDLGRRTFAAHEDLALLLFTVPPLLAYLALTWPAQTIR